MRWKYRYGTLPDKMIELGWEKKINNDYRHQGCYVETMYGTTIGTGFVEIPKEYKVIWFGVSLLDLVAGSSFCSHIALETTGQTTIGQLMVIINSP